MSSNSSSSREWTAASKITIGTTDQVVALDPAGSYDNGSLLLEDNLYQFLMNVPAGGRRRRRTRREVQLHRRRRPTPAR